MTDTACNEAILPLSGLRIVELANGKTDMAARLLADLGADVILVEPPTGLDGRHAAPLFNGYSLHFATHHANKRSLVLDLRIKDDQARFLDLLGSTDLLFDGLGPNGLAALGLAVEQIRTQYPGLVVVSVSDFGLTGPYRDYTASHCVHTAMSGVLCRSGKPGRMPLLVPGLLCWESAAIQVAWGALLAVWQRRHAGLGEHLDISIQDAIAQILDPALGVTGSAQAGKSALDSPSHGRPEPVALYPIVPCKDGFVRFCTLNPRQWQGMCEWLGPDHPFQDPKYGQIAIRRQAMDQINALVRDLFSQLTGQELLVEAQRRGIPIAIVAEPAQVLTDEHFKARGSFANLTVGEGVTGLVPSGFLELDGVRLGIRRPAPALGQDSETLLAEDANHGNRTVVSQDGAKRRPLEGLRVLDLGVIVAGAEAGRLMADQGAEVIKIENKAFPDGGRQSSTGLLMTPSIAQGHRNKESIGINLRSDAGRELFRKLVANADVVLSNFKPGTLESLGLGYETLKTVNPGIVVLDSSAMGNTGPQSKTPGYGPLVRASAGLTAVWRYPDLPEFFGDGVTIFPDHVAGRIAVIGVLAALLRRQRTGIGGSVSVSQAEIFLNCASERFLLESLQPGSFRAEGNQSAWQEPDSIYPCEGDDNWCAISVTTQTHWQALLKAIDREDLLDKPVYATAQGRIAHREEINSLLSGWTSKQEARAATRHLQAYGVPAGFMLRLSEYRDDPQLAARAFIRELVHPGLPAPLPTENRIGNSLHMPDPPLRPAPLQGEHTREVARRLLGLAPEEIEALIIEGVLEA
ncbi:CoA transferase [Pseudomonas silvicola]|nr:CoA transferase [Pseudomonas silvicola]